MSAAWASVARFMNRSFRSGEVEPQATPRPREVEAATAALEDGDSPERRTQPLSRSSERSSSEEEDAARAAPVKRPALGSPRESFKRLVGSMSGDSVEGKAETSPRRRNSPRKSAHLGRQMTAVGHIELMKDTLDQLKRECEQSKTHTVVLEESEIDTLKQVIEHFADRARLRNSGEDFEEEESYEQKLRSILSDTEVYDDRFRRYIHHEFLKDVREHLKIDGHGIRDSYGSYGRDSMQALELQRRQAPGDAAGAAAGAAGLHGRKVSFASMPGGFTTAFASSSSTDSAAAVEGTTFPEQVRASERGRQERRRSSLEDLRVHMGFHADPTPMERLMAGVRTWDFDIFMLEELGVRVPILHVGICILQAELGLVSALSLDAEKLSSFLVNLNMSYRDVPYHCALHAADVAQGMLHFLIDCGVGDELSLVESLAAVIAALAHDVAHPGVSSGFLVKTNHELAMVYNDNSPLENMHAARCFQLLQREDLDFLSHWRFNPAGGSGRNRTSGRRWHRFRLTVIEMIMATDNSKHKHLMEELAQVAEELADAEEQLFEHPPQLALGESAKSDSEGDVLRPGKRSSGLYTEDQRLFLLKISLHTADVANPARPWRMYTKWTARVMDEFYAQGDKERELGFTVSPGFDKLHPVPLPAFQKGFILALVKPLIESVADLPGIDMGSVEAQLQENLSAWEQAIYEGREDAAAPKS